MISVSLTFENSFLITQIEDTGVGMKEDDLQRLFKNFGKLEDYQLINKGGLGLGLTISKTICELLGGSISVDSKLGVGSRFTF